MAGFGDCLAELRERKVLAVADIEKLISVSRFANPNGWTILVAVTTGSAGVVNPDHPVLRHGTDASPK